MSALGQRQICAAQNVMSALPPKADIKSDAFVLHVPDGSGVLALESCSGQAFKKFTLLLCGGVWAENFIAVIEVFRAQLLISERDRHALRYANNNVCQTKEPLFDQSEHTPLQSQKRSNRRIPNDHYHVARKGVLSLHQRSQWIDISSNASMPPFRCVRSKRTRSDVGPKHAKIPQ